MYCSFVNNIVVLVIALLTLIECQQVASPNQATQVANPLPMPQLKPKPPHPLQPNQPGVSPPWQKTSGRPVPPGRQVTPLNSCTSDKCQYQPEDCLALHQCGHRTNGVYKIYPPGTGGFQVLCDMKTDGGGWTIFQRRYDGSQDFFLGWRDYQFGFGRISGEHWLGNQRLHEMTSKGFYELRIDMQNWKGVWKYAKYRIFSVDSVNKRYKLNIDGYIGDAGDSLSLHDGMGFYTKDTDTTDKCATKYKGAWWYQSCHYSNLNGKYFQGGNHTSFGDGMEWFHWHGYQYSLKTTEMKFRRR